MNCKKGFCVIVCCLICVSFCLLIGPLTIESQHQEILSGMQFQIQNIPGKMLSRQLQIPEGMKMKRREVQPRMILKRPDMSQNRVMTKDASTIKEDYAASKTQPGIMPIQKSKGFQYREGEVLVSFKSPGEINKEVFQKKLSNHNLSIAKRFSVLSQIKGKDYVLIRGDGKKAAELLKILKDDPCVDAVSLNYCKQMHSADTCEGITPNDEYFDQQWALCNTGQDICPLPPDPLPPDPSFCFAGLPGADIKATKAWKFRTDSSEEVVVAVVDTGVDFTHPDLKDNMWENLDEKDGQPGVDDDENGYVDDIYGYSVTDGDPMDYYGHGTHIAGIIGAAGDNEIGVSGINWNARIMAVKAFSDG